MEKSGVIRRVDQLGRLVVPIEYRRLVGIELGDPIEMIAMENGDIIVHKVDTARDLVKYFLKLVRSAADELKGTLLLTDGEHWLAGCGPHKDEFIGKKSGRWTAQCVRERRNFDGVLPAEDLPESAKLSGYEFSATLAPALSDGDCYGALCLVCAGAACETDKALTRVLAGVLGQNMQRY